MRKLTPELVFYVVVGYFLVLIVISFFTSRNSNTQSFFSANKRSPWYLVAYGMIGATLSGVTFISVPGAVLNDQFAYFQIVIGYLLGYFIIGVVLLPLYYRLQLVSIYGYLEQRFGFWSYKTGAFYFLVSRIIGASFRLFLAATVLQIGLFDAWGVAFWQTTIISVLLIWVYTYRAGIKTIVWTDTLQTTFLILAAVVSVYLIKDELQWSYGTLIQNVQESKFSKVFYWDLNSPKNFFKQFFAGASIAVVMTGLDQDMMQKNLTCPNIKDAQKNVFWFSIVLVIVNLIFLTLGALLYIYATEKGIVLPAKDVTVMKDGVETVIQQIQTDKVFPTLAFKHFGLTTGIFFLLGIIAATYSSADSALTALTTSFCVDFLGVNDKKEEREKRRLVKQVHVGFSVVLVLVVVLFKAIQEANPDSNVIGSLFTAAGYTYGPLLGLFTFGMITKNAVKDRWVPLVCILSPVLSYVLNLYSAELFNGFKFGFEILIVNGLITFIGLWLLSTNKKAL
ncbi:sodium:solute symporter [marine bacterium AO1-C]|nr:sodium:solute symporter [marine bacterium AO1-C]